MKRKTFIGSLVALAASPAAGISQIANKESGQQKGFKISSGEGRIHGHLQLKGVNANILDVKISGTDTNGQIAVFEQTSLSQGRGTPLHIHHEQDEIFYVIAGNYAFQVGDVIYNLSAGDSIFLPRKIAHAWTQISPTGKMTVTVQPAGKLENFFVKMSSLEHEPGKEEIAAIFAENGMQVVGPPLKAN